MILDSMSYKAKFTVAVIATLLTLSLVGTSIPVIPVFIDAGASLWIIVVPLALTLLSIVGTAWLWKQVLREHAVATGKLYPGEKLARQLQAEHGGELLHDEPGINIRDWTITVQGADGFSRTIMTKSGKEVS